MWWQERLSEFVTLFLVLNPIAAVPVFLAAAGSLKAAEQRKIAAYAVAVSFAVLVFFVIAGGFLLARMGIPIRAFQIAGGIVMFVFAVNMVLGQLTPAPSNGQSEESLFARAVYPLAIPKIAGPGAMLTVMVLTDDDRFNWLDKTATIGVVLLVLLIQLVLLLLATPVSKLIGEGGANVIGRVFGMLLAALAANIVVGTVADWLNLPKL
jgi:multiple antibiotic resistance protein